MFFKKIKEKKLPYIIAEIGVNHECSLKKAKKLIDLAAKGGANAAKFQTYKASLLASKYSPAYWDLKKEKSESQYKLFKKYDKFDKNDYKELYLHCKKKKIDFASTPFDEESVNFLNPYLKFFKIASADINNLPLLKKVAQTKKPVIISTGASYLEEIKNAKSYLLKNGSLEVVIMHCILNYPTSNNNANLNMITDLKKKFPKNIIGYSDHTLPDKEMLNLNLAYLLGAKVIEKHFTDKKRKGNDHYHSMNCDDLKKFFLNLNKIKILTGKIKKKPISSEFLARRNARRSIVANLDIKKGTKLRKNFLITKRPAHGISPENFYKILGKKTNRNIKKDQILLWKYLK